ncbi:RND transporter [Xenophilus aerolatus]|nr:RND transporter [Xenophilus aerolatus]
MRASISWDEPVRPRTSSRAVGLLGPVLMLAGCASMAPPLALPEPPVAAQFPLADAATEPAAAAAGLAWSDAFPDPQLQALIALSLANNRDLRAAALRVQEAQAQRRIQGAEAWPTVGASMDAQRARVPGDLNVSGEPIVSSQYRFGVGLADWELDFWGRVRSLDDAALQSEMASADAWRAASLSLVGQVAQGWLALRELDERLLLARAAIDSRDESLRIFTRRVEVGATSRLDLAQVRVLAEQARALGTQLAQQRAQQANVLALLAGAPVPTGIAEAPPAPRLPERVVLPVATGLPSSLLADRPDIAAAEHQLRAANASIGAARAAFFPRITLTGSLGTASAELDHLFHAGSRALSFAPSVSLPLFTAGRLRGSLDVAELRRDMAVAAYEKAIQSAFRDVADALGARRWLADQLVVQRAALAAQAERARLARLRYDAGSATFLEVLDAQRDLLAAEQQRVQTQRALLSSQVALYIALGGGSRVQSVSAALPHP